MTKEEILTMEAGRELDNLVADTFNLPQVDSIQKWILYSSDILAAWQVVEKLKLDGDIYSFVYYLVEILWIKEYGAVDALEQLFTKVTPRAICKAALLAKLTYVLKEV